MRRCVTSWTTSQCSTRLATAVTERHLLTRFSSTVERLRWQDVGNLADRQRRKVLRPKNRTGPLGHPYIAPRGVRELWCRGDIPVWADSYTLRKHPGTGAVHLLSYHCWFVNQKKKKRTERTVNKADSYPALLPSVPPSWRSNIAKC